MTPLRHRLLSRLVAAALLQLPLAVLANPVCGLADTPPHSAIAELCPVEDGLARIRIGQAWGFVDTAGKVVVAPQFDEVRDFSEGYAAAGRDGKWGLIDKQGKWAFEPFVENLYGLRNGRAVARVGDRYGYLDISGKWAIAPRYTEGSHFVDGVAAVEEPGLGASLIDREGRVIKRFPAGVSVGLTEAKLFRVVVHAPSELVHVDGRRLPAADTMEQYHDGGFIVTATVERDGSEHTVYGLQDMAGTWVSPARFASIQPYRGHYSVAKSLAADANGSERYGIIDRKGNYLVKPVYDSLGLDERYGFYVGRRAQEKGKVDLFTAKAEPWVTLDCDSVDQTLAAGELRVMAGCGKHWLVHARTGVLRTFAGDWQVTGGSGHLLFVQSPDGGADKGVSFVLYSGASGQPVAANDPTHPVLRQSFSKVFLLDPAPGAASALPLAILGHSDSTIALLTRHYTFVTHPEWRYNRMMDEYEHKKERPVEAPLVMKGAKGYGAVDLQGRWVVQPVHQELTVFRHGLAIATSDAGVDVLVDASGASHAVPKGMSDMRRSGFMAVTGHTAAGLMSVDLRTGKATPAAPAWGEQDTAAGGLTPVQRDGKWGLRAADGTWTMLPGVQERPAPLVLDEQVVGWSFVGPGAADPALSQVGLLDSQGRLLVKPRYTNIEVDRATGLLVAEEEGYLYSVLDARGRELLPALHGQYRGLGDGWFRREPAARYGLVDLRGEWIVKPGLYDYNFRHASGHTLRPYATSGGGMLDFTGRLSTHDAPLELAMEEPSHWWWSNQNPGNNNNTRFYGFNFALRLEVPGIARQAYFSEGVLAFTPSDPKNSEKQGLVDDKGRVIGLYQASAIARMAGGLARITQEVPKRPAVGKRGAVAGGTRHGYLNRAGKLAIPIVYPAAGDFAGGRATVATDSGLAMIDTSGKVVLQGAWQCGRTPVLMNGARKVVWPDDAGKPVDCKR